MLEVVALPKVPTYCLSLSLSLSQYITEEDNDNYRFRFKSSWHHVQEMSLNTR